MKMKIFSFVVLTFLCVFSNEASAQYASCPNQGTDVTGHIGWRLRNPSTGIIVTTPPAPGTIYQLEIFETPFSPTPPTYIQYGALGIMGSADGFKLYQSVSHAQTQPSNYYSEDAILSGVGKDVTGGVVTFGIKTLDATDPNWTGQLTAFKGYGACYPSFVPNPTKYFKKTLVILP